jgi:hypothetical protein
MNNPAKRLNTGHKETIWLTEIFSLKRQCQALIGVQKSGEPVRPDGVSTVIEDHSLITGPLAKVTRGATLELLIQVRRPCVLRACESRGIWSP